MYKLFSPAFHHQADRYQPNSIWFIYFVDAFQESTLDNLVDFITSDFQAQSLLNVIYVVGYSTSAAIFIPLSKIMDVWGRAEGFLFMAFCCTLGLILMACSTDISTFCAAYVRPVTSIRIIIHPSKMANIYPFTTRYFTQLDSRV
jgi:MFS family permease